MKTISVAVSEVDYEEFQRIAKDTDRSVAQLIRAAMSHYRATILEAKGRLTELDVFEQPRPVAPLPDRSELHDEMLGHRHDSP